MSLNATISNSKFFGKIFVNMQKNILMFRKAVLTLFILLPIFRHAQCVKLSSSGCPIIHDDHPVADALYGFQFLRGNGPRYHSTVPVSAPSPYSIPLSTVFRPDSTPAASNPFMPNPAYGPHYPTSGAANCAMPPKQCEKTAYRTLDGSCNHLENPQWGIANSRYGRLVSPKYADGISAPTGSVTGGELPSARLISLVVFDELNVPDPDFTLINMQWGQIVAHDMSMQAGGTQSKKHPIRCCTDDGRPVASDKAHKSCFAIIVPPHDPAYSQVGTECLNFVRTVTDRDTNCFYNQGPAEQLTAVTSYLDLSLVYGNSNQQNKEIRAFHGGRMIVEERNGADWLPTSGNITGDCDDTAEPNEIGYMTGDIRANQSPGLTILHTVLLREHNRIADTLAKLNPHYDDHTLFQEARKINIAQYQHVSYYEWLPILLGTENMLKNRLIYKNHGGSYVNDFDPNIDPSVLNSYATAAFRYFHTQINGRLDLLSEMRSVIGSLRLSDWYNRPCILEVDDNFDCLTRGHATQPEELADNNYDKEIKHFLFRRNNTFGLDLRAIDIQRNRDHGLASYNDYKEFCGLGRAHTWEDFGDLISPRFIEKLKTLYDSHEDVDVTVGGSLEKHDTVDLAGATFLCILTEQFYRTRVGDRFFFENGDKLTGFTPEQLAELRKASMARLLCDNGKHIQSMQTHAFISVSKSNPVVPCTQIPQVNLTKWIDQKPYGAAAATLHNVK